MAMHASVESAQMPLIFDDAGNGPAIVFLHAGVADRRMWASQVAAFATTYRVITPDLAGWGESPLPSTTLDHADDVVALLDALEIDRATLVGASFGGRVALEVAMLHPERVDRLALLAPAFRGLGSTPALDALDEQEEALLKAGDVDGAVELEVSAWLGPEASDDARNLLRVMQRRAYDVYLAAEEAGDEPSVTRVEVEPAAIAANTLIVSGAHDIDLFQTIARHLTHTIPRARLVTLPWAGHLPSLERPDEINAVLAEFLR